jgi:ketosteroid isomerase-like protein
VKGRARRAIAESTVDQVWYLTSDLALSTGHYHTTGKKQDGRAIEFAGQWTEVNVREGGGWKIRMLSVMRKQPQPAK